jgi:Rrf2 family protein
VRVTSKGRYAVRALFDLAYFSDGAACQVKEIAERQEIPFRFLEQIFQDLKRAGLVASKRGPQGGFTLERPGREIRLSDVLRAVETPSAQAVALHALPATSAQLIDRTFDDLAARSEAMLDTVTLADLCRTANELGLNSQSVTRNVYCI